MTKTRSVRRRSKSEAQDFWPSFTDVMSTVAMLLFFLMLLAYIQNIMSGRQLSFFQSELENTRVQLAGLNAELDGSRKNLDETLQNLGQLQQSLEDTRWTLIETEEEIAVKEDALKFLEEEVGKTRAEVDEGQKQLAMSKNEIESKQQEIESKQREIESQQQIIATSNQELVDLRTKLSEIAVMRVSILEKVSNSIESALGRYTDTGEQRVSIGPNANIVINETLLFDYASAVVKDDAKQLLDQFAIAFEKLLDDPDIRLYIDYINIEGHTDSTGSAGYNRGLSAERAVAVVNYIMESNPNLESKYAPYFGIGGFSKFRPLASGEDDESMAKNRRIEISVVVKDENIRSMIDDYLDEAMQ